MHCCFMLIDLKLLEAIVLCCIDASRQTLATSRMSFCLEQFPNALNIFKKLLLSEN